MRTVKVRVLAFLMLFAVGARASALEADLPQWLQQYPHALLVQQKKEQRDDYVLPVGKLRKVDGVWRAQKDLRLKGQLQRMTWTLPDGHSVNMAKQYYEALMASHDAQRLYGCESRECGSSAQWANGVFNVSELYGPDRNQVYRAYVIEDDTHWSYLALYLIERGNQRRYIHIDYIRLDGAADGSYLSLLDVNQHLSIRRDELKQPQTLAQKLGAIAQYLQANPAATMRVVGHAYGNAAVDELTRTSLQLADQIVAQLVKNGVDAKRVAAYGVGPLAPRGGLNNQDDRIEVQVVADN